MDLENTTTPPSGPCEGALRSLECPYNCSYDGYEGREGRSFESSKGLDWYHFLLTSLGTWLVAALIVLIPRLIYAPLKVSLYIHIYTNQFIFRVW